MHGFDIANLNALHHLKLKTDQAIELGNHHELSDLLDKQTEMMMTSLASEEFATGSRAPIMANPYVAVSHEMAVMQTFGLQMARREFQLDDVLQRHNFAGLEASADKIVQAYKQANGAELVMPKPGMSPEEMAALSQQFKPVPVPEDVAGGYSQQLVKLDNEMKQLGTSVWNDPRTARVAKILSQSAEHGKPGYMQSQSPALTEFMNPAERALMVVRRGAQAAVDVPVELGMGVHSILADLGLASLDGMTLGNAKAHVNPPTAWAQDKDGSWYHNGGKVGSGELFAGIWYGLTGHMIDQQVAEYDAADNYDQVRQHGFEKLATGVSQFLGGMVPFMGAAVPGMAAGRLVAKGLTRVAIGDLGALAAGGSRAAAITDWIANTAGEAAGLGLYEATKKGSIEGYGATFAHGAIAGVPMLLLGLGGRKLEGMLNQTKMPRRLNAALSGAVEGLGFTALDNEATQALWSFVKNPNGEDWATFQQHMLVNLIGMATLKGSTGLTPENRLLPPEQREGAVSAEQQVSAGREVAAAPAAPEEVAGQAVEQNVSRGTLEGYRGAVQEQRAAAGSSPAAAIEAKGRADQFEQRLNVEKAGNDVPEEQKLEARYAAREELDRLKEMPPSHEKNKAILNLLENSRLAFRDAATNFQYKMVAREAGHMFDESLADLEERNEYAGGMDTYRTLMKRGDDIGKFQSQRRKVMQEGTTHAIGRELKALGAGEARSPEQEADAYEMHLASTEDELPAPTYKEAPGFLEKGSAEGAQRLREQPLQTKEQQRVQEEEGQASLDAMTRPSDVVTGRNEQAAASGGHDVLEQRVVPEPMGGQPASMRLKPSTEKEGVPGTPKIRESDVLREMEGYDGDAVRVPIRSGVKRAGMTGSKGVLGWYHTRENQIRYGPGAERMVIAAHEWSHAMQRKTVGMGAALPTKELTAELVKAAATYPGIESLPAKSQISEGWAEFWARHMLDDPKLQAEVPNVYAHLMNWISQPRQAAVLKQMQRIQSALRQWRELGSLERGKAAIVFNDDKASVQELKARGSFRQVAQHEITKAMTDDVAGIKKAMRDAFEAEYGESAAEKLAAIPITDNPARLIDVFRMTALPRAEQFLKVGTADFAGRKTGESLKEVFRDLHRLSPGSYKDFWNYFVAKRNLEAIGKGKPAQLDRGDYLRIVEQLESPEWLAISKRVTAYGGRLVDHLVDAGAIDKERGDVIKASYEFYAPFYRDAESIQAQRKGGVGGGTGIGFMKGSQLEIKDPMQSFAELTYSTITKAQQANVLKAAWKLSLTHPGLGGFFTEVPRDAIPKSHPLAQIAEAIRNANEGGKGESTAGTLADTIDAAVASGDISPTATLFSQQVVPKGSKPIIAFTPHLTDLEIEGIADRNARAQAIRSNHKLIWAEMDPDAYKVLAGIDQPQSFLDHAAPFISKPIQMATTLKRIGVTGMSPFFAVKNLIRDVAAYGIYSKDAKPIPFWAVTEAVAALRDRLKSDPSEARQRYMALGGEGITFFGTEMRRERAPQELVSELDRGVAANVRRIFGGILHYLSEGEQLLRVREATKIRTEALANGKGELEANLLALEAAKEVTLNFTRAGSVARTWNRLSPYFTANIAGKMKFLRAMLGYEGREFQMKAIARGLSTITVMSALEQLLVGGDDWHKELPEYQKENYWTFHLFGQQISLPKPQEFGALFANPFEMAVEHGMDRNPVQTKDFLWDVAKSAFNGFDAIPQIAKPMIEAYVNRDLFTGQAIVPDWMGQQRMSKDQYNAYTTMSARWIGKMVGISPMQLDHFIRGYGGNLPIEMLKSVDESFGYKHGATSDLSALPFIGGLIARHDFQGSRSVADLMQASAAFDQRAGSKDLSGPEHAYRRMANNAKEQISQLKKQADSGRITHEDADRRSAEIAQRALSRIQR